jgi:hypothetical protein
MHADISIKQLLARLETLEAEVAALRRENRNRGTLPLYSITPCGTRTYKTWRGSENSLGNLGRASLPWLDCWV